MGICKLVFIYSSVCVFVSVWYIRLWHTDRNGGGRASCSITVHLIQVLTLNLELCPLPEILNCPSVSSNTTLLYNHEWPPLTFFLLKSVGAGVIRTQVLSLACKVFLSLSHFSSPFFSSFLPFFFKSTCLT